ncbi:MAG: serine protease [Clostridium sp.]|nr:serine protease [Clostridium sp.]
MISFISDKVYTALSLAEDIPKYGDKVAAMSNPNGKRNIVTAGKISSKKLWFFNDEAGKTQYPNVKHSAIISGGSSGGALLNEDLEIVGINLGGNENIFHQFTSGMAMPNDQIHDFLEEWEN